MLKGFLAGLMVVGAVSSAVGASGVIAPTFDNGLTGRVTKESAETGVFPPLVDLKLATWNGTACGTFTDNLDSPLFTINSGSSRSIDATRTLCVRNDGTSTTGLRISVQEQLGTDVVCSEDEIECSSSPRSLVLNWSVTKPAGTPANCPTLATDSGGAMLIVDSGGMAGKQTAVGVVLPVGVSCRYDLRVFNSNIPYSAQTEVLTWRFRVDTI